MYVNNKVVNYVGGEFEFLEYSVEKQVYDVFPAK